MYSDNNRTILDTFEVEDMSAQKSQRVIGGFYSWFPTVFADIVDLYIFGKLSFEDIAAIKQMETARIERIFQAIKKSFRKNLN